MTFCQERGRKVAVGVSEVVKFFTSIESKLHNRSTLFYNTAFSSPIFATCKRRCCDCLLHDTCPFHDQCLLLVFQPPLPNLHLLLSKHLKSRDHRIYSAATSTLTILVTAFPECITDLFVTSTSPNYPTEPELRPFAILKFQHRFNQWTCNLGGIPPPTSPLSLEASIRDTVSEPIRSKNLWIASSQICKTF